MIIQKIFSSIEEESEKLYSVLMSEEELSLFSEIQKEFGNIRKANRIAKKAWEAREGKIIGDALWRKTGINLSPESEKIYFRMKNVVDTHGGQGVMKHPVDSAKDLYYTSMAGLTGRRNIHHKINTKSIISGPTSDHNAVNGDSAILSDFIGGRSTNQSRYETMRTGGRQRGRGGVFNNR